MQCRGCQTVEEGGVGQMDGRDITGHVCKCIVLTCASMYALAYCASTMYRDRRPYRPKSSFGFLGGISPPPSGAIRSAVHGSQVRISSLWPM